jgi:signal transduction histidine kinase
VQSASALDAIDTDVDAAKDAIRIVRAVARKAMPDLRGALAMLRATGSPELLAQPRLADLPDLVDSVRATGLAATLTVEPVRPDVTPFVELAAYRVVQEALTNVVRHASARSVSVTVTAGGGELVVSVVDDGHGVGDRPGNGFGLLGMRERVALVAGTVQIGPGPSGRGTAVVARLPLGSVTTSGG